MVHVASDIGLQCRLDIGEEEKIGVFVFFGDARLERLEDVEMSEVSFRFVQVVGVSASPAEGLPVGTLDAANIDTTLVEDIFLLESEVIAHDRNDPHLSEVARGERKVGGSACQNIFDTARGRGDVIECHRTDYEYAHARPLGISDTEPRDGWSVVSRTAPTAPESSPLAPPLQVFPNDKVQLLLGCRGNLFTVSEDGVAECGFAFAGTSLGHRGHRLLHHLAGVFRVLDENSNDLINRDRIVMRMPAVIIGDHCDRDIANLGLAGEFGFLQVGHTDDVHSKAAVDVGLGLGGKLWAFHAEVRSAALADDADLHAGVFDHACEFCADGVGETDVRDNSVSEESIHAVACAIEELVGDHEVEGLVLFLQRSDRGDGDDALDAQLLEPVDVSTEIQFAGQDAVAASVTREEGHLTAFERTANVGVGSCAERSLQPNFFDSGEARHGIQATAPDDSNFRLGQTSSSLDYDLDKLVIIQERKLTSASGPTLRLRSGKLRPPRHVMFR